MTLVAAVAKGLVAFRRGVTHDGWGAITVADGLTAGDVRLTQKGKAHIQARISRLRKALGLPRSDS